MSHNHIDLYQAHGLDRGCSSPELAAQLTAQLATTADPVARRRIQVASAILGDDARRAAYDSRLADPQAPPITEDVLAQLAGMPPQTTSPLTRTLLRPRVLATVAAALVALLALLVSLAACGGGDDSKSSASGSGAKVAAGTKNSDAAPVCWTSNNELLSRAKWDSRSVPTWSVLLTQQIDLPQQFAPMAQQERPFGTGYVTAPFNTDGGLVQYQDRTVGVLWGTSREYVRGSQATDATMDLAVVDPSGTVVSHRTYNEDQSSQLPKVFDLANDQVGGYYRIEAEDIELPAQARGVDARQNYAVSILRDVDEKTVWVLLRGSSKLYKGAVYNLDNEGVEPSVDRCGQ
ncbi:hypothetical protein [Gordonia paraffinivorans]|uniref:hypothetical protein n=1 Tax=Gordonia paraffinivorans TaxID=175628 RepID=UPI001E28A2BD|nr:hypothetical protein [Gordonia paraffinivorans]MCD2143714.1 hypothetical protein [Gordonia paraffinivorans]